ncbi:MAG TPA: hypothetical protein VIK73_07760 [Limnochordales bacterium]
MVGNRHATGWLLATVAFIVLGAAKPADALLEPRPQPFWRAGIVWGLTEADAIGLDWGIGVKVPLQPSEVGVASLAGSLQGTLSARSEWDFRLGGVVENYRSGRPLIGVYYTLRRLPLQEAPFDRALNGIAIRYGSFVAAFYPSIWNQDLAHDQAALVLEPGWFSGLYIQLRYATALGAGGGGSPSLRLSVGLEEGW